MKPMDWTEQQKVAHIMEALSRIDLSPELLERIQGWIVHGESSGDNYALMDTILDKMFLEYRHPTLRTCESFAVLCVRLGLPAPDAPVKKRIPLRRAMLRSAAVFVGLAVLGGTVWFATRQAPAPVTDVIMAEAVHGKGDVITLPDGSTVRPLDGSHVTVAENFAESRLVSLMGEAFFSVTRDEARPFTVRTEGLTARVLGTEFNMKAWPGGAEQVVSLVSGSVRVEYGAQEEELTLAPMEQLLYNGDTGEADVESFSPGQIDRWRFGRKHLNDFSLAQALHAVGGFYDKKVFIEGSLPEDIGVTIVLSEIETVVSTLEAIKLINDVFEYTIEEGSIYIVGKR